MSEIPDVVRFYRTRERWGAFSNFARYPVSLDGHRWPTTEHYYQAQKTTDPARQALIRRANSPRIAARLGRDRSHPARRGWDGMKVDVMRRAVAAKFTQHDELRELLLSTGDARIVERSPRDGFWGDGPDGRGRNWLGRVLMEVRAQLREEAG